MPANTSSTANGFEESSAMRGMEFLLPSARPPTVEWVKPRQETVPDPLTQSIEEEEQEEEQEREEDFLWDPEELSLPERPGFTEADIITISSPPAPAAPAPAPPVSSQIEMPQQMAEDTASDSGCTMEEFIAQLKEAAKEPCEHDVCFFDGFVPGTKDYAFRCRGCGHRFVLKLARYKYPHVNEIKEKISKFGKAAKFQALGEFFDFVTGLRI